MQDEFLPKKGVLQINGGIYLDLKEAAAFCGLSESYVRKLHLTGQVPSYRRGDRNIFFKKTDIEKLNNLTPTNITKNKTEVVIEVEDVLG